jgi:signal transduction histidine kinase
MRRLTGFYRDWRLGLKLSSVAFGVLAIMLALVIVLIRFGVQTLSIQAGRQRVEDEVKVIQSRLNEAEQNLLADTKLIASSPGLAEAVSSENADRLRSLVLASSATLTPDSVSVFNADGQPFEDLAQESMSLASEDQTELIKLALLGIETTRLVMDESGGLQYVATVTLRDNAGTIVGGLLATRRVDDEFLEELNFARSGVDLLLINQGRIVAHYLYEVTTADGDELTLDELSLDKAALANSSGGQAIVGDSLVHRHGELYAYAYTPVSEDVDEASIAVLIDVNEFFAFQNQLVRNLIIAITVLGLATLGLLSFVVRYSVTLPLSKLQNVAGRMVAGNYWQRVQVKSKDEIGQLSHRFNDMAHAVQSRETELQNLADSLEQKVEERTSELQAQATRLVQANRELAVARKQAEDATRLKSEFLSTMSHELRTPLSAINGYTQIMLAGMAGNFNNEQLGYLNRIWSNGKHLLGLINDVLDLAKIEAGRIEVVKEPLVVRDWLDEITDQIQGLAEQKNLNFEVVLDERMPRMIVGDAARLKQIALNLLSNAIKFTNAGSVKLIVRNQGRHRWELVVSDTGIGIPSHAQEYIFDEFRQVDGTSRRKHGGTGLGLTIVRNLCLMMGGNIRVTSQVGKGSTFTVLLPLDVVEAELV